MIRIIFLALEKHTSRITCTSISLCCLFVLGLHDNAVVISSACDIYIHIYPSLNSVGKMKSFTVAKINELQRYSRQYQYTEELCNSFSPLTETRCRVPAKGVSVNERLFRIQCSTFGNLTPPTFITENGEES